MTQNQINYAKLKEEIRHNQATEGYTGVELAEANRHNVASEGINWYSATETGRHNLVQENINWYTAQKQGEAYEAQAWRNYASGSFDSQRAEMLQKEYELEKGKFEHQVWKDIRTIGIDESKLELSQSQWMKQAEKYDTEIADILYREGLDFEKYQTEYAKAKAGAFRDYASGALSATDAFLKLFDWAWGLKQGLLPRK